MTESKIENMEAPSKNEGSITRQDFNLVGQHFNGHLENADAKYSQEKDRSSTLSKIEFFDSDSKARFVGNTDRGIIKSATEHVMEATKAQKMATDIEHGESAKQCDGQVKELIKEGKQKEADDFINMVNGDLKKDGSEKQLDLSVRSSFGRAGFVNSYDLEIKTGDKVNSEDKWSGKQQEWLCTGFPPITDPSEKWPLVTGPIIRPLEPPIRKSL